MVNKLLSLRIEMLELNWQDIDNVRDCGVYTLKHMETYNSQDPKDWDAGFNGKDNVSFIVFRLVSVFILLYVSHQFLCIN